MLTELKNQLLEKGRVDFTVRARPSAPATKVLDVLEDESVKIAIAAAPEGGKANAELVKFLAGEFGVRREQVTLLAGHASKLKLVRIRNSE